MERRGQNQERQEDQLEVVQEEAALEEEVEGEEEEEDQVRDEEKRGRQPFPGGEARDRWVKVQWAQIDS